jgi:hypothetical protein
MAVLGVHAQIMPLRFAQVLQRHIHMPRRLHAVLEELGTDGRYGCGGACEEWHGLIRFTIHLKRHSTDDIIRQYGVEGCGGVLTSSQVPLIKVGRRHLFGIRLCSKDFISVTDS